MFSRLQSLSLIWVLSAPLGLAQGFNDSSATNTLSASLNTTIASPTPTARNASSNDTALACNSRWLSYNYNRLRAYTTETVSEITLGPATFTKYLGVQTCSSYCGSICYAGNSTRTGTTILTETFANYSYSMVTRLTYSDPAPNCTIPPASCKSLWSDYSISEAMYSQHTFIPPSPTPPACTGYCTRTRCGFGGGNKGIVPTPGITERFGNSLQLLYWPETANISRDMCAFTPTDTPVVPPTSISNYAPVTTEGFIVMDGKTFYRGNAYVSIPQMEVSDNCGFSTIIFDVAFPVASSEVYSARGDDNFGSGYFPVKWADFNDPIPYSAYVAGRFRSFSAIPLEQLTNSKEYCKTAVCDATAVLPGSYYPDILLPRAVQNLNPEFAGCTIEHENVFFDPPIALHGAPNFLTTASSHPVTIPAEPANTPTAPPARTSALRPSRATATYQPGASNQPPSTDPTFNDPPSDPAASNDPDPSRPTPQRPGAGPYITVGPTIVPIAPDGQGIIIHSGTTIPPAGSAIIDGTTFHLGSGVLTVVSPAGTTTVKLDDPSIWGSSDSRVTVTLGGTVFTIPTAGATVISGTTFHIGPGSHVLTMESPAGTSSITITDPGLVQPSDGSATVTLGGRIFTIGTSDASLVLDTDMTLTKGDPGMTIGDMVVSVNSDGVVVENTQLGNATTVAFADAQGATRVQAETAVGTSTVTGETGTTDVAAARTHSSEQGSRPSDAASSSVKGMAGVLRISRRFGLIPVLAFGLAQLA